MAYYMGVYGDVAKQFAAAGYTFVGYDLRGHGRS
jgi:alpha-beta hydrolase superfamily lysophospholipase